MNENNIQSNNNIPELQSPFEQLREVDVERVKNARTRVN